jgi:hypothetical protein
MITGFVVGVSCLRFETIMIKHQQLGAWIYDIVN